MSMQDIHDIQLQPLVTRALEEDCGYGDWPTDICIPKDTHTNAQIIAKEPLVVACIELVTAVFGVVDSELKVEPRVSNGTAVHAGEVLAMFSGRARSILKGERVALNFLARLCGIATLTTQFVAKIADHKAQLLDTRDTTPGLRMLEKAAAAIKNVGQKTRPPPHLQTFHVQEQNITFYRHRLHHAGIGSRTTRHTCALHFGIFQRAELQLNPRRDEWSNRARMQNLRPHQGNLLRFGTAEHLD